MLFSPLEQFEIYVSRPITFYGWFDISLTNASFCLILGVCVVLFFLIYGTTNARLIPTRIQYIVELLYIFVLDIVKQQAGVKGVKYFPLFSTIFILVLTSNIVGLLPYAFTPTSHLAFTFFLALSCNLASVVIGFKEHGLGFLQLFVPKGGPRWLFPLIVVIEVISYLLRTFSLSIRLFANMMAGHTLLHILASSRVSFSAVSPILSLFL
jgi:F-type H+-transporting ATPase subunit a